MKKTTLSLLLLSSACVVNLSAKNAKNVNNLDYDNGLGFLGVSVGVGGISNFGVGIVGGYQYFFKEAWQFGGHRHGVRGIASINYGNWSYSLFSSTTYNSLFAQVGADWTIDFSPANRKYVWGAFVGLSLGYFSLFSSGLTYTPSAFVWSTNLGGSLTIARHHKIEAVLGYGFSTFSLRYLYHF